MNRLREATGRLMSIAQGRHGTLWLPGHEGDGEYVLIRREDLELALATLAREEESPV